MTYRRRPDNSIVITHTGVPRAFEGRGFALQLVKRAVADARRANFKIVPQCPYVAVQFRRHPDWSDLLA
ncbi:N-acetyltransferase [Pelagibacterium halotolerans]|nr:N-acetyltransferase [Pelagibacterium halotolerans]